jgi:hypothetical protein
VPVAFATTTGALFDAHVLPAQPLTLYVYVISAVDELPESVSLVELPVVLFNDAPFFVHVYNVGVKPVQFAVSETLPPVLGNVDGLAESEQLPPPVLVPVWHVTVLPLTVTLLQPEKLTETSACARDAYVAAAIKSAMPNEKTIRGRAKNDGFDGFMLHSK